MIFSSNKIKGYFITKTSFIAKVTFNGFESTLIFKVRTQILPVKANFTPRNMFSAQCVY